MNQTLVFLFIIIFEFLSTFYKLGSCTLYSFPAPQLKEQRKLVKAQHYATSLLFEQGELTSARC
jgi:hypothetical protein